MYEYPELNDINDVWNELWKAIKHDPLLHQCYMYWEVNHGIAQPFDSRDFFIYLSYMALSMNQKHVKMVMTTVEHSVNPSIVIHDEGKFYAKGMIAELLEKERRTYWQKLWDAIKGR